MNKLSIFVSALAMTGMMASCSEEHIKMPWEDDLNAKHNEEKGELPEAQVGQVLPRWAEGCLDIHLINTGRGECIFYIMPDGTTMVVDAGEIEGKNSADKTYVDQKPNASTRPSTTQATYMRHFLPAGKKAVDYFVASHFHVDHIGEAKVATEDSPNGYKLAGICAVYDHMPINHFIDRAYPNYKEDTSIPAIDSGFADEYIKFINWGVANKKFDAQRFQVGKEQIVMLNNKAAYSNFKIFNICGNGNAWVVDDSKADGGEVKNYSSTGGNPASCGFHLKYGKFDYVACGDLVSSPQNAVANYLKSVMGTTGFEVFKCHHHLSANSFGSGMLNNNIAPRVFVNQNFSDYQPDADLLNTITLGNWTKDFFTTNLHPGQVEKYPAIANQITGTNGHIVVRVAPGGDSYYVYVLDDTDMVYRIKAIHGPYASK